MPVGKENHSVADFFAIDGVSEMISVRFLGCCRRKYILLQSKIPKMTARKEINDGRKTVYVDDLAFLGDRTSDCTWLQRHFWHHRLRLMLRNADRVVAGSAKTADDLVRYYFIPRDRISVGK